MESLFSFPNPVNETSARLVAGSVAVLAVLAIAFQQGWLLPVLAYGFLARVLTGPTLSPLGLLATRVVTPRLNVRHRYSPGPAKRFAQAIGALFTVTATLLYYAAGQHTAAFALVGVLAVFASLEAGVRALRRLQDVLSRDEARARAAAGVRGLRARARGRVVGSPVCSCRSKPFRTSRRVATARS